MHLLPKSIDVEDSDDSPVDIDELERSEIEALFVARRIHELMGQRGATRMAVMEKTGNGFQPRPIEYRDIVILLRSMRYKASQFSDILRAAGIPTYYEGRSGFFETTEVRDLLSLLHVLDNQKQDIPLAAVLRGPLASLAEPEDCLVRIRMAYPDRAGSMPFHEAVERYAVEQDDELAAALRDRLSQIARWRELAHRRPLAEVIWSIYEDTGYLAFCNGLPDGEQRSANLIELHERARQFGTFQRQGLARFMKFLDGLASETDIGAPSVASGADNVVQIMSIHKSKGLEFPVVIIPDIGKKMNLSDAKGSILMDRKAHLGMSVVDEVRRIKYPSIATTLVKDRLMRQSLAEELRVLYVALTRAREHLILVGTAHDNAQEKWAARWSGHSGAFPTDMILGACSMLDWLGPAATVSPDAIELIRHTSEEVSMWPGVESLRQVMSEEQARMARLEPQKQAPAESEVARNVIHRMSWQYPQRSFAELSAARSVTSWPETPDPPSEYLVPLTVKGDRQVLALPHFLSEESATRAADVGLATHLALEHLDFSTASDAESIQRQLSRMVERKLLGPDPMKAINLESLAWLMQSTVGSLLREHHAVLRRELPIYFAIAPQRFAEGTASDDPRDCVMIRGRIDVLVPTKAGLVIVDYKTDRVSREHVESHAETYRSQMQHYREAIETIAGQKVSAVHLTFLTPRVVHTLKLD
jgi:ATP-dependent helicase/nuclease subunit A